MNDFNFFVLWNLAACYLWTVCENDHRTKWKFTANCTVQEIPAKTAHASESRARQEIDFVMLSMCHGMTSGNLHCCRAAEPLGRLVLTNRLSWLALWVTQLTHQFSCSRIPAGLILWPTNRFDLVWTFKLLKFCLRDSSHPLTTYCLIFLCLSTLAYFVFPAVCFLCKCTSSTLWLLQRLQKQNSGNCSTFSLKSVIAASPYLSMHREL